MTAEYVAVDEALAAVLGHAPTTTAEGVAIDRAIGRVLAAPCDARWPLPSAPLSIMDGYAVRSLDLRLARDEHGAETLALELVDESAAGHPADVELAAGTCTRIATGAVVPVGADAVVPQEDTRRIEAAPGRVLVEFSETALAQIAEGRWIRPTGSDVEQGERLLDAGAPIGPGDASLLASAGHFEVAVRRRPRVAILGNGDELVAIGTQPRRGQVVSTNEMMLAAQVREAGGEALVLAAASDDPEVMRARLREAAEADLVVTSGGISVGDHDLVLPSLEALGWQPVFRKVRLRPGRPTTYGLIPAAGRVTPVLALPGNPASSFVAFELFARPLIRAMLGLQPRRWQRARQILELAAPADGDKRREHYVRATVEADGRARPLTKQLSGALRSLAGFDVLLRVPEGRTRVEAGEGLEALILRS